MHISSSYAKILGEKLFRTWEIPRSGSKAKNGKKKEEENTPGTADGPGGRDRTLAIKSRKTAGKKGKTDISESSFCHKIEDEVT